MVCKILFTGNSSALTCAFFILSIFTPVFAQQTQSPAAPVSPKAKIKVWKTTKIARNESSKPAEKSIAADAKVNVSLCVSEGKIKINGWERDEIRAFVENGSEVGFDIGVRNKQNRAALLRIVGFDPAKNAGGNFDECLSGDDIEIDVPRGATVNIKGQASDTIIDSVNKARVEIVGGNIFLDRIAEGIEATTYQGNVIVQDSSGAVSLASTTGNIVAFGVAPDEIGDIFKAKTNSGAITLQNVAHRQMEINSSSGSIKFVGEAQNGGQYKLGTLNGSIQLFMPANASGKINASYGLGVFNSEIPLRDVVKNANPRTQSLTGTLGAGDANFNLTTYSGAIRIKKQ